MALTRLRAVACAMPAAALAMHDNMLGSLTAVVDGRSMFPTFNCNCSGRRDRIILNRMFGDIEKGDVIVLRSPRESQQLLIKRVTGLEGDFVQGISGQTCIVPPGHIWVEGDNKPCSLDSRQFGPVERTLVEARVAAKVWPLEEARFMTNVPAPPGISLVGARLRNMLWCADDWLNGLSHVTASAACGQSHSADSFCDS